MQKIAAMRPQPTRQQYTGGNRQPFNIRDWMMKHRLAVKKEETYGTSTKYVLERCPFNESHTGKDAVIFESPDGAVAFHCFHNSCSDKRWQDLRLMFEPDAYEPKQEYEYRQREYKKETAEPKIEHRALPDQEHFLLPSQIKQPTDEEQVFIKSRFNVLDRKIIGFAKGELSIWSGGNGSGKSSVLSQLAIETVQQGYKIAIFSGELEPHRTLEWLQLQCAGSEHTLPTAYENYFHVMERVKAPINKWLDTGLYIYNNDFGSKIEEVLASVEKCITDRNIDVLVLDNLMSLDLHSMGGEKYDKQTALVKHLAAFAKKHNIHIHFVCHPRKTTGFLRKTDISGTADITNAADNVFIVHRVNTDFKNATQKELKFKQDNVLYNYSNVVEVCKNRKLGVLDLFIGLHFEVRSKRFLNFPDEQKHFAWEDAGHDFADLIPDDSDWIPD